MSSFLLHDLKVLCIHISSLPIGGGRSEFQQAVHLLHTRVPWLPLSLACPGPRPSHYGWIAHGLSGYNLRNSRRKRGLEEEIVNIGLLVHTATTPQKLDTYLDICMLKCVNVHRGARTSYSSHPVLQLLTLR